MIRNPGPSAARNRPITRAAPAASGATAGRGGVLADVQAEDAAAGGKSRPPAVGDERGQAVVVEAEPVDQRLRPRQAEHARPDVARLRQRRHRPDLDEAEAERAESV